MDRSRFGNDCLYIHIFLNTNDPWTLTLNSLHTSHFIDMHHHPFLNQKIRRPATKKYFHEGSWNVMGIPNAHWCLVSTLEGNFNGDFQSGKTYKPDHMVKWARCNSKLYLFLYISDISPLLISNFQFPPHPTPPHATLTPFPFPEPPPLPSEGATSIQGFIVCLSSLAIAAHLYEYHPRN